MSFPFFHEPIEFPEMNDPSLAPSSAIASCLREARTRLRLTREALSELVGVSAKSIQRYEEARQIPRVKTLEKLGQVLDIPVDEFFRQIESPRQRTRSRFDELAAGQREILSRLDDFLAGYHVLSARVNSLALALEKHIDTVSSRCGMGTD